VFASTDQLGVALEHDDDIGPLIEGARNLFEASLKERISRTPVFADDVNFQRYLQFKMKGLSEEQIHVVYLGEHREYLRDECIARGSAGKVSTHLRVLFKRALDLGARGIVLAHNHPSGKAEPSKQDIEATDRIASVAQALDLVLYDHLILTDRQIFSIRKGAIL
jgi:DNA repair protein RadC